MRIVSFGSAMINTDFVLLEVTTISRLNMICCGTLALIMSQSLWFLWKHPSPHQDESAKVLISLIWGILFLMNAYISAKYFNLPFGHLSAESVEELTPIMLIALPIYIVIGTLIKNLARRNN